MCGVLAGSSSSLRKMSCAAARRRPALLLVLLTTLVNYCVPAEARTRSSAENVVRQEINALNDGDVEGVLNSFSAGASVFGIPKSPDRLIGELSQKIGRPGDRTTYRQTMFLKDLLPRTELVQIIPVGDLAAVKLKVTRPPDFAKAEYSLFIYRIRGGRVQDLWHLASAGPASANDDPHEVIRRLIVANNKGDLEAFLSLFSADSKHFRNSGDRHILGDRFVKPTSGRENLRRIVAPAFTKGFPGHASIVDALTVGDLVVTHDQVALPNGDLVDQMKTYRVRNGLITHDWTPYEQRWTGTQLRLHDRF